MTRTLFFALLFAIAFMAIWETVFASPANAAWRNADEVRFDQMAAYDAAMDAATTNNSQRAISW